MAATKTLKKRAALLEDGFPSPVEELLTEFVRGRQAAEVRAAWRRTRREVYRLTPTDELLLAEFIHRTVLPFAAMSKEEQRAALDHREEMEAWGPDPTPEEQREAARLLRSQPAPALAGYVEGLEDRELWTALYPVWLRMKDPLSEKGQRPFWDL